MEIIRSQVTDAKGSTGTKASSLIADVGKAVEKEIQAGDLVRKENKGLHARHINLRQLLTKKNHAERYAAKFHEELSSGVRKVGLQIAI